MKIIWYLMMAVTLVAAMETPAPQLRTRKYACCPNNFGYYSLGMDAQQREIVYPCDLEETRSLDDEAGKMEIRTRLFKCLLVELAFKQTLEAKQSFELLIQRLRTGRIKMSEEGDGGYTTLTRKDFFHRMLAHLPGYIEIDPHIFVSQWSVGLVFVPCIHTIESFGFKFTTEHEHNIFSDEMQQQFEAIKPFPSLMALAVRAIKQADRKKALELVPPELKSLFN